MKCGQSKRLNDLVSGCLPSASGENACAALGFASLLGLKVLTVEFMQYTSRRSPIHAICSRDEMVYGAVKLFMLIEAGVLPTRIR